MYNNISEKILANEAEYNIIHGDLNFSNIMINPENQDIKFIDPRGGFGKTKVFGSKDYDYAKILYALYGYDNFQQSFYFQPSLFNKNLKSIEFNIANIELSKEFLDKYFKKIHYALLIVIWLGLAQYTKNNYWKCICSYYHALSLEYLLN
jgi:5-methylthioribose kinase